MRPHVRSSSDPYVGLETQLTELIGLVKIVPPLIEADRQRRWEEIGQRPGDENSEMIDIYEEEAGPEEGYGFADYGHTVHVAAVVTAWEAFREYLIRKLYETAFRYDLKKHPVLAKLVIEERQQWSRRFDILESRYRDFLSVQVTGLPSWKSVTHARHLRNALVHNLGQYTQAYLNNKMARRPTEEDLDGSVPTYADEELVDRRGRFTPTPPRILSCCDELAKYSS